MIRRVQLQNSHDHLAIEQLIIEIKVSKNYPVNIMFDEELSNIPYYTFVWTVLGTLLTAGLIIITTYERYYNEIIFKSTNDPANQFLSMAAHFSKYYYRFFNHKDIIIK